MGLAAVLCTLMSMPGNRLFGLWLNESRVILAFLLTLHYIYVFFGTVKLGCGSTKSN